jgi:hypothetical protein
VLPITAKKGFNFFNDEELAYLLWREPVSYKWKKGLLWARQFPSFFFCFGGYGAFVLVFGGVVRALAYSSKGHSTEASIALAFSSYAPR